MEKNKSDSYTLFYRKKIHKEASTVADHLPAYFLKLYRNDILPIFDPYFQDLVRDATWVDDQPYYEDNLELYKVINDTVDLEWIENVEQPAMKKRVYIYE